MEETLKIKLIEDGEGEIYLNREDLLAWLSEYEKKNNPLIVKNSIRFIMQALRKGTISARK